jgi:2-alkenal reductase
MDNVDEEKAKPALGDQILQFLEASHTWKPTSNTITSCMMVFLMAMSFAIGGLLGGIAGGGLVLWAIGERATPRQQETNSADIGQTAAVLEPPPTATATPVPSVTPAPPQATPTPTFTPVLTHTPTPSIADSVSQVLPAVVTIINRQVGLGGLGTNVDSRIRGSGTIVDPRGYIATNYHVIQGAGELTVVLGSGAELPARLVATDIPKDIALVRVENGNLPTATWGDSGAVRLGEWAIVIGSALGDFPNSVTVGVISGLDRSLALEGDIQVNGLIQTDAAINKGNSGGPLVNQRGEVIGINTFIIRENQRVGVAEGIGFAIPSSLARQLIEQWIVADQAKNTP